MESGTSVRMLDVCRVSPGQRLLARPTVAGITMSLELSTCC